MFEFNVIILKNTAKLRFYFLTAKRVWENIGAKVLNGFISCPMFIPLVVAPYFLAGGHRGEKAGGWPNVRAECCTFAGKLNIKEYKDMNIDKKANQEKFEALLRATGREGMDYVLEDLAKDGFFEAPASAGHHLNVPGGLCEHSLNVCRAALMVWEGMCKMDDSVAREVSRDSVVIASLLHDVCKTNIYKPALKRKKNSMGVWEDVPGYNVVYNKLPLGHGEKSVIMLLLSGLDLTDEEMLAIRWHMGAWGLNFNSYEDERSYDTARTITPLVSIVQVGDGLAASILERTAEDVASL